MPDVWVDSPSAWADINTAWQPAAVSIVCGTACGVWSAYPAVASALTAAAVAALVPGLIPKTGISASSAAVPSDTLAVSLAVRQAAIVAVSVTEATPGAAWAFWSPLVGSPLGACHAGVDAVSIALGIGQASGQPQTAATATSASIAPAAKASLARITTAATPSPARLAAVVQSLLGDAEGPSWRFANALALGRWLQTPTATAWLATLDSSVQARWISPVSTAARRGSPLAQKRRFGNPPPDCAEEHAMQHDHPYVGTVGFCIEADCQQDISTATDPFFLVKKPSGATATWTASLTSIDGETRYLRHVTENGELNEVGDYKIHACLTLGGWKGPGEVGILQVRPLYA